MAIEIEVPTSTAFALQCPQQKTVTISRAVWWTTSTCSDCSILMKFNGRPKVISRWRSSGDDHHLDHSPDRPYIATIVFAFTAPQTWQATN
jgi:hypothetical protein